MNTIRVPIEELERLAWEARASIEVDHAAGEYVVTIDGTTYAAPLEVVS